MPNTQDLSKKPSSVIGYGITSQDINNNRYNEKMKKNHSFWALLIALAVHGVLIALVWNGIRHPSQEIPIPDEKRFGISLSEALEISDPTESAKPLSPHSDQPATHKMPNTPISDTTPQKKALRIELKHLTQADRDKLPTSILHHYGEEFFNLSAGEQHYIIDNLQRIRKLNEIVGTRLLRERYHDDVDPLDNNVVEFILHPDGTISDLHLEKNRIGTTLDELTLQTINLAHPKYPKPDQESKIRIRVYIIVKE
jgi:hypothetical protein